MDDTEKRDDNYWKKIHNDTIYSILETALELGFPNLSEEEKNKLIKK